MAPSRHRTGSLRSVTLVVALLAGCGAPGPGSASPGSPASPTPATSPAATVAPTQTPTPAPVLTPLAVVTRVDDTRQQVDPAALAAAVAAGTVTIPCGVASLEIAGRAVPAPVACRPADQVVAAMRSGAAGALGLLPPGLVVPQVKVLAVGSADLFGSQALRSVPYPLQATLAPTTGWPDAWTAYAVGEIRTLVSTGDTCPDRGVSHMANVVGKGWDWVLGGGTARYTGTHWDSSYGWYVVDARRTGDTGKVRALIADADVAVDDFECPMFSGFVQHDTGTVFSIDPRVAPAMARAGYDLVTLGSNHITDGGTRGVRETLADLDAVGIKHVGAGLDLAGALAPAVVDVRGVRFAFVGWDDIAGSGAAAAGRPGVAPMTDANVRTSLAAAARAGDVVIAMPQWGWPEYHADFTKQQLAQRALFYASGANHILGSGTHWAGAISITPGQDGSQLAVTSHGNFLFDQSWSRQTEEGVIVEAAFVGTRLAQVRLHPYVVLDEAQPNLVDPTTDGAFVLKQVFSVSEIR